MSRIYGRVKKRMKVFALYTLLLTGITVFSLWLGWRLCLYSAIGWLGWRIWHAPGFRAEYRASFLRMATVSVLFILLCEYAIFAEPGR
ncbi:hypothetical protein ABK622_RS17365 [Escherichia coli]